MKQSYGKWMGLAVACMLTLSALAGCAGSDTQAGTATPAGGTTAAATKSATAAPTAEPEPVTLTYWIPLGDKASQVVNGNADILAMQAISENTGIQVEFQQPAIGQEGDQFNLMIASRTLPDMVFFETAKIMENLSMFLPITDKIDEYAPNYGVKIADESIRKALIMSDGEIYTFAHLRLDPTIRVWMGAQIRGDWLDALDMDPPATIDEWYSVLTAFKENDMNGNGDAGDEIPFVSRNGGSYSFYNFSIAWGLVLDTFYQVDGTVYYSPYQPEYEQFITEMNKWYEEGLLDKDWAATDGDSFKAKVTSSLGGAFYGSLVGVMGAYNQLLKDVNPEYRLVGAPWVECMDDGVAYNPWADHAAIVQPYSAAISAGSEAWQSCMSYLDYGYSDEGNMIMNFGIEGVSYTMVDGYPTFTEEVTSNPDGLTFAEALAKYAMSSNCVSPFIQDPRQFAQYSLGTEEQAGANALWSAGDQSKVMPALRMTNEELSEYSEIMSELTTYVSEMSTKFVMGLQPLSDFDDFYATLKSMDIERAIEIQQDALDRYNGQ